MKHQRFSGKVGQVAGGDITNLYLTVDGDQVPAQSVAPSLEFEMQSRMFAAAAMLIAVSVAARSQEPEQRMDVKGVELGALLSDVKAKLNLKCGRDPSGTFDQVCLFARPADRSFAGNAASAVRFGFFDGRLDSVHFEMPGAAYDQVQAALDSKFGEMTPHGPAMLRSYMRNGDRVHLMSLQGKTVVMYEAAAGHEERQRRADAARQAVHKDM